LPSKRGKGKTTNKRLEIADGHNEYYQFLLKFTAKMLKHGVDLLKEIPLDRTETRRMDGDQSPGPRDFQFSTITPIGREVIF